MENKNIVNVYIYYGDDQSRYLYNSFKARRNDCDSIYNSLVDGPYVCSCRSYKDYSDNVMIFHLACSSKDNAIKVFERIEGFNEEKEKVRVFVNIYYKPYSNGCQVQFDEKLPVDDFDKIVAFLNDSTRVESVADVSDFITFKMITITCSDQDDALTIKEELNGFAKKNNEPVSKVDDTLVSEEDNTPKNNNISSEIEYIAKNLDDSDLFLQLAEKAAELSQACLKYVRAYRGNNPTKDSEEIYLKNILEELTNVRVSADVLNIEEDIDTYINKIHRWADRIRCRNVREEK